MLKKHFSRRALRSKAFVGTQKLYCRIPNANAAAALQSQVGKGITAQASHRTVREPLDSYGSCYTINYV